MEVFLEQSVRFDEGNRIYGTYIVNSQDPQYLRELTDSDAKVGHVDFDCQIETNQLSFTAVAVRSSPPRIISSWSRRSGPRSE